MERLAEPVQLRTRLRIVERRKVHSVSPWLIFGVGIASCAFWSGVLWLAWRLFQ